MSLVSPGAGKVVSSILRKRPGLFFSYGLTPAPPPFRHRPCSCHSPISVSYCHILCGRRFSEPSNRAKARQGDAILHRPRMGGNIRQTVFLNGSSARAASGIGGDAGFRAIHTSPDVVSGPRLRREDRDFRIQETCSSAIILQYQPRALPSAKPYQPSATPRAW